MLLSVIVHSLLSCFFFFNRTATTEIYTYLHTLSLHDALPIYARRAGRIRFRAPHLAVGAAARPERTAVAHVAAHRNGRRSGLERRLAQRPARHAAHGRPVHRFCARHGSGRLPLCAARSEEHTSELQSLMRISYAVFCLKKKKHKKQHETHHY